MVTVPAEGFTPAAAPAQVTVVLIVPTGMVMVVL